MSRRLATLFAAAGLLLGGCATISDGLDAINPFSSSGPKMAPLPPLKPHASALFLSFSANSGTITKLRMVAQL